MLQLAHKQHRNVQNRDKMDQSVGLGIADPPRPRQRRTTSTEHRA